MGHDNAGLDRKKIYQDIMTRYTDTDMGTLFKSHPLSGNFLRSPMIQIQRFNHQ